MEVLWLLGFKFTSAKSQLQTHTEPWATGAITKTGLAWKSQEKERLMQKEVHKVKVHTHTHTNEEPF